VPPRCCSGSLAEIGSLLFYIQVTCAWCRRQSLKVQSSKREKLKAVWTCLNCFNCFNSFGSFGSFDSFGTKIANKAVDNLYFSQALVINLGK